MGMYTEFHYNVELKSSTRQEVLDVLQYMLGYETPPTQPALPDHPLFQTTRWAIMLRMSSAYFPALTRSDLIRAEFSDNWILSVRCNLKNYDSEIEKFCAWIDPYVDAFEGDFLGFSRYEESEDPVVIRKL